MLSKLEQLYCITFYFEEKEKRPVTLQNIKSGYSLSQIALMHHIQLNHDCGGVCTCSTCFVDIIKGAQHLEEMSRREKDVLKKYGKVKEFSRLGCQCLLLEGTSNIEVLVPRQQR